MTRFKKLFAVLGATALLAVSAPAVYAQSGEEGYGGSNVVAGRYPFDRKSARDVAMSDALVERFLYREARLMDTHRYEEWLALWTPDARYWVPCNSDDIDPAREVSIIYDDYERLEQRVQRLKSGTVLAQDPAPRMRRIVSNIEIETVDAEHLRVGSNFLLAVAREREQQLWAGHSIHGLRRVGDGLRMHYKKVLLINSDQEMPLLQFLI